MPLFVRASRRRLRRLFAIVCPRRLRGRGHRATGSVGHIRRVVVLGATCVLLASPASASADLRGDILARIQVEPLIPSPRLVGRPLPAPGVGEGGVLSRVAAAPIWVHQTLISPQDGDRCVFTPSCSAYAAKALKARGVGGWPLAADRILRCHHGARNATGRTLDPFPPRVGRLSLVGALASLLPGGGQWVGGNRGDAAYALGTVGLLAWGASHYAREGRDVTAAALGGLGLFFYVGNIYGGARALGVAAPQGRR